jgi:hypothetical protein
MRLALALVAAAATAGPVDPGTVPAPEVAPDAPKVSASVAPPKVALGKTFSLFVRVTHPPGMQVNLPASLPLGGAFEETARTDTSRANPDGTITSDFEVGLMAFEVGEIQVPPMPVTYVAGGRTGEVATEAVPVEVFGVIGEGKADLRDISGPVGVERPDLTLVYVAAAVGGVLLLGLGFWLGRRAWRRRRRTVLARLPEAIQRSAHEEALARLAEVEGSGALDADERKPAYLDMSEILRAYIGRRYGFPALDLTTDEIRRELDARGGGPASDLVCDWLARSDLVKFAGHDASPDEARQALYDARIYIDKTRPTPQPQPGAAP